METKVIHGVLRFWRSPVTPRRVVRPRSAWAAAALAAAFVFLPAAPLRPAEEPVIEEDAGDAGKPAGIDGAVRLSDGTVIHGKVSLPEGARLRLFDARVRRAFYLDLGQIAAIRTVVEHEAMEEAWTWEEEGSRKKVALGWKHPLRNYGQEVELRDGTLLAGHLYAATLYIDDGAKERRLKLPRQDKGARGQTLADLVYVASVDLSGGKAPRGELASLAGEVPGLEAAAAIDLRSLKGAAAAMGRGRPGSFRIDGLLPGRHAVFLRTKDEVRIGLPGKLDISQAERAAAENRIASIEEFFDGKKVLLLGGDRKRLWAFLEMTRAGGTTLSDEKGRSYRFRRWEVWALRADGTGETGEPWRIESRIYLDRAVVPSDGELPAPACRLDPALESVDLGPGPNALPGNPTGK